MRFPLYHLGIFFLLLATISCQPEATDLHEHQSISIRGWNILTDWENEALATLEAIDKYDINHLQLSHHIIMDLKDARDTSKLNLSKRLMKNARSKGIEEIVVWDHALYKLNYYPAEFKTGPDSTLNLDNDAFWNWLKQDYREMLDLVSEIDGLVLTFIETGARAEDQYSAKLSTHAEKLAAVVNAVAEVVIEERAKKLYIRTFAYNDQEYENLTKCIDLIESDQVILMMKESPHDFFLTHPNSFLIGKINRPTIVEFDCGNEFNGQSMVANTWPEHIERRWKDYMQRPNIIGYVARTDRYGNARAVGTPNEILLYALDELSRDSSLTAKEIRQSYITKTYGKDLVSVLEPAFSMAYDIITSSLYTLGLNSANHSRLDFHYPSIYVRHVSGRWMENKEVFIGHDVNREFHYFKDIVNHVAPAPYKKADFGHNEDEIPDVFEENWLEEGELINAEYLDYIIAEKDYGVRLADSALSMVQSVKELVDAEKYKPLIECFERTYITARMRAASAKVYYGNRLWSRGGEYQSPDLENMIAENKVLIKEIADEIMGYKGLTPEGQWSWKSDAERIGDIEKLFSN